MSYFIEVGYDQLIKKNEDTCGDQVEIVRMDEGVIVVISDGLGSGIKANILATLTVKIAATMLKNGANLADVLDTITNTLPVCKVRGIAYSTFTIVYVKQNGDTYIAELDNPTVFYYSRKQKEIIKFNGEITIINDKKIREIKFRLNEEDKLIVATDGVIHAGVGEILNYGWEWHHVAKYLQDLCTNRRNNAMMISKSLIGICYDLYNGQASDDATALTIKMKAPQIINIFTGPPLLKEKDPIIVKNFFSSPGKRIVCGGTAANIVARELKRDISIDINTLTEEIPPISKMRGLELITEGAITMKFALEYLKDFTNKPLSKDILDKLKENNGASILANKLLNEATHINFFLGHSLNVAHKKGDQSNRLDTKFKNIGEMINILRRIGKIVNIHYY
ncbi:Stage II sporulation protein E (SpoIIE) [Natronincola peptidivorans]|uniref:Stage II sporulation protein E (SpoIIE) n=1 Tax=Natronincola peptidivorans TaxID=426128 RepID=A0A1I0F018_9FIRM|nr:SpoIIE family protein phosphatase [Natronincola peptidivorans]SET50322.1 Stage II sporulation protein E (SpoIIE) [Natronincola peptidivorans]